jgi:hypothetical protein
MVGLDRRVNVSQPRNYHPRAWVTFSAQIHHQIYYGTLRLIDQSELSDTPD